MSWSCLWRIGILGCHSKIKKAAAVLVPPIAFDVDDSAMHRFDRH
jgi:hypothetical protein